MKETNNILLNMMKHQLLSIYQTFTDIPKLLNDPAVSKGYETLLSVTDDDELLQWRKYIADLGLSFANTDGMERSQNVLGELDDLVSKANYNTIVDFIKWKCSFDPSEWEQVDEHNGELVKKIHAVASRDYDVHIVIILCALQWVAIGNDADRLFEIFGWQTSSVYDGEKHVSFMFISDYGFEVLKKSGYSIQTIDLADEESEDDVFFSDSFTEDMVAQYQQHVDYMRLLAREKAEFKTFMTGSQSFVLPKLGYNAIVNSRLSIGEDTVTAVLDDGSEVLIADGHSWRLDDIGLPYLLSLGKQLGEA